MPRTAGRMVLAGNRRPASEQLLPDGATVTAGGASRGGDQHAWLCRLPGSCAPKVGLAVPVVHTLHLLVHSPSSQLTLLPYSMRAMPLRVWSNVAGH